MIFLSYARGDDEHFVRRLYDDLIANGFKIWYDRTNMPNRALTFHQEIRDAIDGSDRLIIVFGPEAILSDYVRAEWQHALNACKIVIPVIRFGKRDLLPNELRKLNCPDMRESRLYADALADLLRVLGDPVVPLAELRGVPSLPAHFQPRRDYINNLKNTVLADVHRPVAITSAKQTTALQGMGGVGKSVLAAAFARSCETRRAFIDGVVWLTMGQQPDIAQNMMVVGRGFNDDLKDYIDIESGKARITKVLADKNCLLVLDDIWEVQHAEAFMNALGTRCRLLITTRNGGLSTAIGAQEHRLDVLSIEEAMRLLADYSGQPLNEMPTEAHDVAKECGNLPFALALCGAMVSEGTPWNDLLAALREADLTFLTMQFPNYPYPDLLRSLKVSVDALSRTNQAWEKQFKKLAVFPHTEAVPEETVIMFWISTNLVNERSARQLLITLERRALIRLEGKAPNRLVSLHDLQHDYLRAVLGNLTYLHGELLEAYRQKCPLGWQTGPNDGYFFQRLVYHLGQAGKKDELSALLFNFNWMLAKLMATSIIELMADYGIARMLLPAHALRFVQSTLWLSAHILARDKKQLRCQLFGRLMEHESPDIKNLLDRIKQWKDGPWLCSITPILTPPGGPLIRTIEVHYGYRTYVLAVSVLPDGKRAISGSKDRTLKVWDIESGEVLQTLVGHTDSVTVVSVLPDGKRAISGSKDRTLKVWDLEGGEVLRTLVGHTDSVIVVSVLPDGKRAISASHDKTLKVWDIESGEVLQTLVGHTDSVTAVSVLPDGKRAISGSRDTKLKLWDLESGEVLQTLEGHVGYTAHVLAVSVLPDGKRAISGSSDRTLKVWDLESREDVQTLVGHTDSVTAVSVLPDGKRAISGSKDWTLKVWDLESGDVLQTLVGHTDSVTAVSVLPDGKRAISGSKDTKLKLWDLESEDVQMLEGHTDSVTAVSILPDGNRVISASHDKTLKLWDIESGEVLQTLVGHTDSFNDVSVLPDGKRAISGSNDTTLKLWDLESGEVLQTLEGHTGYITAVSVLPDGIHAISGSSDRTLKLWDLESGEVLRTLKGHTGYITAVSVLPDGKRAISGSHDTTLKLWDLESGEVLQTLKGHTGYVTAVSVLPDGKRAISGSNDRTLKLWDLESGEVLQNLEGHTQSVTAVSVLPDGKRAISGSWDNTLNVWDLEGGEVIASFSGDFPLFCITFSQDGKIIITGESSGKVHFLSLENVVQSTPIVTAWRKLDQLPAYVCPLCRTWSKIPTSALGTEIPCLHCGKPIKLNHFTACSPVMKSLAPKDSLGVVIFRSS